MINIHICIYTYWIIVYSVEGVKDACIYSIEDERHRVRQWISTKKHTNKRCEILRTDKMTLLVSEKKNIFFNKIGKKSDLRLSINNNIFIFYHRIKEILCYKNWDLCSFELLRTSKRNTSLRFVCSLWTQQCTNSNILIIYHKK